MVMEVAAETGIPPRDVAGLDPVWLSTLVDVLVARAKKK